VRFSKLRLSGFKSFVDPTDLIIEDGLTGVVGPNGCGKSNLLEALRWVMGENRPTAMRGGGMEDVIFAGAATRPARNFAEVCLHLDNSERLAPSGFNQTDSLDIVRRITRDAGSAYKANGNEARARDVQMLFADASTGAHSPALVRQGQISELINAKPKSRRRILEEAAGISGLYQRRHEAELKLKGAEGNLERVDDVLEQLASQMAQLARQAKQAARYRAIGEELRKVEGMLLYRRWKEADEARQKAQDDLRQKTTEAARAEAEARKLSAQRQTLEDGLPPLREEEAISAAVVQRLQVQRDTLKDQEDQARQAIDTLGRRIEQLGKDIDREVGLNRDAGDTIARLQWETEELSKAGEGHNDKLDRSVEVARLAARVLKDKETALSQLTEDVARLAARHQSVQRFVQDSQILLKKSETELAQSQAAVVTSRSVLDRATQDFQAAGGRQEDAVAMAGQADATLLEAEAARSTAQTAEQAARADRSEAEGEANALSAALSTLRKLVERDTDDSGHIVDHLRVEKGFEKALGAALADDLRAPELTATAGSGWQALPAYAKLQPLPVGVAPLQAHVSAPAVLTRRLDQIGLVTAEQGVALQAGLRPGQRLVSRAGDLWRWDGFIALAADMPSAAALRLEQRNRLEELTVQTVQATDRMAMAQKVHAGLSADLDALAKADTAARDARREADRQVAEINRVLSRAEAEQNLATGKLENLSFVVRRHQDEVTAAVQQRHEAEAALAELEDLAGVRGQVEDLKTQVEAARSKMIVDRSAQDTLRREGEARARRSQEVTKEIGVWQERLATAETRSAELADRKVSSQIELQQASATPDLIAVKRDELSTAITEAETRRQAAGDHLAEGETLVRQAVATERDAERAASDARESRARAEARADAAQETVAYATDRICEAQDQTPEELLGSLELDPDNIPASDLVEADVSRLKRQRDALGAVNLRAEEDAKDVTEEHTTLLMEKTDLEAAIKTLRAGISSLNREGRERLLTAFEQVNSNFTLLFQHLFGGGEASLVMVESEDPLEAGLEIMCQPPGKKLSTLSLLSGGEQTLTALALIFAVFLANPAPICVLDEVDAPLDDANVTRFCDLLDEMCRRTDTRFLIITHHAVTMARMDRLFGVTMQEQGVSQLVSVDLKRAAAMVG
jgi:chromosome segregation protein